MAKTYKIATLDNGVQVHFFRALPDGEMADGTPQAGDTVICHTRGKDGLGMHMGCYEPVESDVESTEGHCLARMQGAFDKGEFRVDDVHPTFRL